ncbi:MAG TPA: aldose 1-epimerase [Trueperaceae bacterium]
MSSSFPDRPVLLQHPSGAEAEVLVHYGANLNRLRLVAGGNALECIEPTAPADMPAGWGVLKGVPVLFPFPGRVKGASYQAQGRTFGGLPVNDPDLPGNHIHGLVATLPWILVERQESSCTSRIGSEDLPAGWRASYPFAFDLRLRHKLSADRLEFLVTLSNPGETPLPFGFGLHPYLSLPLQGPGTRADCTLQVSAASYWPQQDFMPIGIVEALPPELDLHHPRKIRDLHGRPPNTVYRLDGVDRHESAATLRDPDGRRRLDMRLSGEWNALVVFRPPDGSAICVEPQTCVPNAVNLQDAEADPGWSELPAGASWSARVELVAGREGTERG